MPGPEEQHNEESNPSQGPISTFVDKIETALGLALPELYSVTLLVLYMVSILVNGVVSNNAVDDNSVSAAFQSNCQVPKAVDDSLTGCEWALSQFDVPQHWEVTKTSCEDESSLNQGIVQMSNTSALNFNEYCSCFDNSCYIEVDEVLKEFVAASVVKSDIKFYKLFPTEKTKTVDDWNYDPDVCCDEERECARELLGVKEDVTADRNYAEDECTCEGTLTYDFSDLYSDCCDGESLIDCGNDIVKDKQGRVMSVIMYVCGDSLPYGEMTAMSTGTMVVESIIDIEGDVDLREKEIEAAKLEYETNLEVYKDCKKKENDVLVSQGYQVKDGEVQPGKSVRLVMVYWWVRFCFSAAAIVLSAMNGTFTKPFTSPASYVHIASSSCHMMMITGGVVVPYLVMAILRPATVSVMFVCVVIFSLTVAFFKLICYRQIVRGAFVLLFGHICLILIAVSDLLVTTSANSLAPMFSLLIEILTIVAEGFATLKGAHVVQHGLFWYIKIDSIESLELINNRLDKLGEKALCDIVAYTELFGRGTKVTTSVRDLARRMEDLNVKGSEWFRLSCSANTTTRTSVDLVILPTLDNHLIGVSDDVLYISMSEVVLAVGKDGKCHTATSLPSDIGRVVCPWYVGPNADLE